MFWFRRLCLSANAGLVALVAFQQAYAQRTEGDFIAHNFHFASGETLGELRIHYTTLGRPRRDAAGGVTNAVLMLHGTTGSGSGLVAPMSPLFAPGDLLDTTRYFVVLPDGIGHGKSSKPSDGLRMKFPKYTYDDMVDAQRRLLAEGLGVDHLRLVMGTSMGCMHAWVWGERFPTSMDALVPLACAPTAIAGRNRMIRKLIIEAIEGDPDWKNGDYAEPPLHGLRAAMGYLFVMTSAPLVQQRQAPTRAQADSAIVAYVERARRRRARRQTPRSSPMSSDSRAPWMPTTSSTRSRRRATMTRRRSSRRSRSRCSPSTAPTIS